MYKDEEKRSVYVQRWREDKCICTKMKRREVCMYKDEEKRSVYVQRWREEKRRLKSDWIYKGAWEDEWNSWKK